MNYTQNHAAIIVYTTRHMRQHRGNVIVATIQKPKVRIRREGFFVDDKGARCFNAHTTGCKNHVKIGNMMGHFYIKQLSNPVCVLGRQLN